jgi:hypothetical protein
MRDAEANLWSVSVKAAYGLFPFFDRIDEEFITYMLGEGRYSWFHNLKTKPLKLVEKGAKDEFYAGLQQKTIKSIYPKPTLFQRAVSKLKRELGFSK